MTNSLINKFQLFHILLENYGTGDDPDIKLFVLIGSIIVKLKMTPNINELLFDIGQKKKIDFR